MSNVRECIHPWGITIASALSVLITLHSVAVADGPDYSNSPVIRECSLGTQDIEETVYENAKGRFARYELSGRHYFDAAGVTFDGRDDQNSFAHWPIKLSENQTRQYAFETGTLVEPASGEEHHNYSVTLPPNLDQAHFLLTFDTADPGDMLYMKVTDPNGKGPFYQADNSGFESAVESNPMAGEWTVRSAIRAGAGEDVGYTLVVDDQPTIEFSEGHGTVLAEGAHRYHDVYIPAGTSVAHFYVSFSERDPGDELYMKLTDPNGGVTFASHPTSGDESILVNNPAAGTWSVRIASTRDATIDVRYSFSADNDPEAHASGCWYGGTINGAWDEYDACQTNSDGSVEQYPDCITWEDPYHHSGVMTLQASNFLVEEISGHDHGDGLRSLADNTIFDGVYLHDIHDDCIENDRLGNLLVTDSFLDGCYSGISARTYDGAPFADGSNNVVEIRNTLIRLEPQPTVYKPAKYGSEPGHGTFFKWDSDADIAVGVALHNNIFFAEKLNRHGGGLGVEEISNLVSCSNNVIVWTGPGPFPNESELPSCFRVTNRNQEWLDAVSAWDARYPGRLQ